MASRARSRAAPKGLTTMNTVSLTPTVPERLPDELLSNYLHRSALWNSYSTFVAFAKSLLPNEQIHTSTLVDIFHPSPRVASLLACFGMSEAFALQELTTLPYWQRFEGATSRDLLTDASEGRPQLRSVAAGNVGRSLTRFVAGKQTTLRACPVCLALDGIPYFRRSHQLPLTRCCYLHGCDLISQCPSCGFTAGSRGLPESASRQCRCGHQLADERAPIRPDNDCWLRLAKFSHEALQPGADPFESDLIRIFLANRLKADRPLGHGRVLPFIRAVYGDHGCVWIMKGWQSAVPIESHHTQLIAQSGQLRAPQLCAAFAQLDSSLAGTLSRYKADARRLEAESAPSRHRNRTANPDSVAEARSLAVKLAAAFDERRARDDLARHHRGLHWYLMIHDRDWYVSKFRRSRGQDKPVPSIDADRRSLIAALSDLRSQHATKPFAVQGIAMVRAMIRDRDWLDKFQRDDQLSVSRAIEGEFQALLFAARNTLLAAPGRPQPLSLTALARAAGMTRVRAATLFRRYPSLAKYREESREAFVDRLVRWGVPEALKGGQYLTASAISRWLGLQSSRADLQKVRSQISAHRDAE